MRARFSAKQSGIYGETLASLVLVLTENCGNGGSVFGLVWVLDAVPVFKGERERGRERERSNEKDMK